MTTYVTINGQPYDPAKYITLGANVYQLDVIRTAANVLGNILDGRHGSAGLDYWELAAAEYDVHQQLTGDGWVPVRAGWGSWVSPLEWELAAS